MQPNEESDVGDPSEADGPRRVREEANRWIASGDPGSDAREGHRIELAVRTSRMHFFDPETGLGIYQ